MTCVSVRVQRPPNTLSNLDGRPCKVLATSFNRNGVVCCSSPSIRKVSNQITITHCTNYRAVCNCRVVFYITLLSPPEGQVQLQYNITNKNTSMRLQRNLGNNTWKVSVVSSQTKIKTNIIRINVVIIIMCHSQSTRLTYIRNIAVTSCHNSPLVSSALDGGCR
jgi:hypothetical protein